MHKNKMSRRDFLRMSMVAGAGTALAACGVKATPPPATSAPLPPPTEVKVVPTAPPPTAAPANVKISFWTPGGSDPFCQGFTQIGENFMKENPNITVDKVLCNPTGENYTERLLANIAAGNPPDATVVWSSPATYAVRKALLPMDDYMAKSKNSAIANWPEGVLSSCQFQGATYGLPTSAAPYGLYYNQELFEAKGIPSGPADFPKTWDDLRKLSKEFTQWDGDTLKTAGFFPLGNPADFMGNAVEFVIWSHTNGGGVFDFKNMKYTVNSEQNLAMMHYALDWFDEQYKGDLKKVQSSANWYGYADGQGRPPAFQEGLLAVYNSGYWFATDIYTSTTKFKKWNVAQYPVGPGGSKTAAGFWPNWLVIPKGSAHPEEAFAYLDYMVVDGMKTWFNVVPDLPANKKFPVDFVPKGLVDAMGDAAAKEINTFFRGQLDVSVPMWNSPVQDFYHDKLSLALEQMFAKTATPEEALGTVQKACQDELDKVLKG